LNKRLGANNVPHNDEPLGGMVLNCLGDTYFNRKEKTGQLIAMIINYEQ
jgi:hypothetical protein